MERKTPFEKGGAAGGEARTKSPLARAAGAPASTATVPLRASPRRRTPFEAVINYGLSYSAVWHLRSLNLNGALLEKSGVHDLPLGAQVELVLRYRYKNEPVELRVPARVVRLTAEGAALTFGPYDDETYTHLVNLLYV